jgi:uncharacterized membrane protein YbhN (UPF0104 family)
MAAMTGGWGARLPASRRLRVAARVVLGLIVLAAVAWRVGAEPFVRGLLSVDVRAVIAVTCLTAIATVAASWRWQVVAQRLGARITIGRAIGMYYRSQFLNTVLPGGVLGDVHRALAHGSSAGDVARASRAVAIERTAGQAVQVVLAVLVVAFAGAEFAGQLLAVLIVLLVALVAVSAAVVASARLRRRVRHEMSEVRVGVGTGLALIQVCVSSVVVVGCHVAAFGVAIAAVGEHLSPLRLAALALVVLLGASIPLNVGGWGPREGIAGWAFATAGLGSAAGVAASTTFGVLIMIAIAPGAAVALAGVVRARRRLSGSAPQPELLSPSEPPCQPEPQRVRLAAGTLPGAASALAIHTRGGRVS